MTLYTPDRTSLPPLVDPEPTGDKRVRRWKQRVRRQALVPASEATAPEALTLAPIDAEALTRRYGTVQPQWLRGTFRVPLGCPQALYEKLRNEAVARYITTRGKQGWELVSRVRVLPGMYPAFDLVQRRFRWDQREFLIDAQFVMPRAERVRIELPSELTQPLALRQLPTSSPSRPTRGRAL